MAHQVDLRLLTLAGIAHRCARETELFFQRLSHDPRYCFELFRRAIIERSHRAWEFVYAQYQPQVARWAERHSAFSSCGEEVSYVVNRAFEKMWLSLTPDKFSRFPDLKSLLRYLQVCVHSVIVDHVRVAEQAIAGVPVKHPGQTVEEQVLGRVQQQEFWGEIEARLRNEKERRVVYGSFILGLKPREIFMRYRETFRDVSEVYRVKENVLARLGRDTRLEKLVGEDT